MAEINRDPRLNPKVGDEWAIDGIICEVTLIGSKRIIIENAAWEVKYNYALSTFKNHCKYNWEYFGSK